MTSENVTGTNKEINEPASSATDAPNAANSAKAQRQDDVEPTENGHAADPPPSGEAAGDESNTPAIGDDEPRLDRRKRFQLVPGKGLYFRKQGGSGAVSAVQLTNTELWIDEEQIVDDGATETRRYRVQGRLGPKQERLPAALVPAASIGNATKWMNEQWGARAIVYPAGSSMLEAAVKEVSAILGLPGPARRIYSHLGWRRTDASRWIYLHAGGAIGAEGPERDVSIEMQGELAHMVLPAARDLQTAVQAALGLVELDTTVASAVWRAPLGEFCPLNFSLFLAGATGTFKSAVTGVAQAHWGSRWDGVRFPANWKSTPNSLEKLAFLAKDAVLVVDDFAPRGTRREVETLHAKAENLLRGAGNLAGRGRMQADTTLRPTYAPRGLLVSSGEDVPAGQSLRARIAIEQIEPGQIDAAKLRQLQAAAASEVLAEAMAGYVQWLAGRAYEGAFVADLQRRQAMWREKVPAGEHRRTPAITAGLMLGLDVFLDFAVTTAVVTATEAAARREAGWERLCALAAEQGAEHREEDPVRLFIETVPELLAAGEVHVTAHRSRTPEEWLTYMPTNLEMYGWRARQTSDGEVYEARGQRIGWLYEPEMTLWLLPDPTLAAVNKMLQGRRSGVHLSVRTLGRRLRQAGLLFEHDAESFTRTKKVEGQAMRVLVIRHSKLWPDN